MPAIPILIAAGIGAAGGIGLGFFAGKGASGVGDIIKWTVIGAGAVVVAKTMKVI